jgi:hypothetical protein
MWGIVCDIIKLESTDKLSSELIAEAIARQKESKEKEANEAKEEMK